MRLGNALRTTAAIAVLVAFAEAFPASASSFTVVRVSAEQQDIEIYLADESNVPFNRFDRLSAWLTKRGKHLRFAMNAGMFNSDFSPVGLLVVDRKQISPVNLNDGSGNFFMKPNGVFLVSSTGARIVESSEYAKVPEGVRLATQSGPLLLRRGVINPAFGLHSNSRHIRNGVGVDGAFAYFVISDEPVTFYELASYFRDVLHCDDALHLDGTVSGLYLPQHDRDDYRADVGPIIGVLE